MAISAEEEKTFLRELELLFMTEAEIEVDKTFKAGQETERAIVQALKPQVPHLIKSESWKFLPSDLRYKILEAHATDGSESLPTNSKMSRDLSPKKHSNTLPARVSARQSRAVTSVVRQQTEKKPISLEVYVSSQRYFYNTLYRQIKTTGKSYRRQIKLRNTGTDCLAYRIHSSTNDPTFIVNPPCGFLMSGYEQLAEIKFNENNTQIFVLFEAAHKQTCIAECFQNGECKLVTLSL